MAQHVAVVTDSSACLPPALAANWGVTVVPLSVVIDGAPRSEGEPGLADAVVAALTSGGKATTSQPSLSACIELLERASVGVDAIVAVTLSEAMSGTAGTMRKAAESVSVPVTVVDARTVGLGVGFAALSAAATAKEGAEADAVAREATRVARSSLSLLTVESLDFLSRGGRVSAAVASIGSALNIRPVLGVVGGQMEVIERVRTAARARAAMLDRIASRAPALRSPLVGFMRLPGDGALEDAARTTIARRGAWPTVSAELSAVLAVHTGPGALAAVVADVRPDVAQSVAAFVVHSPATD